VGFAVPRPVSNGGVLRPFDRRTLLRYAGAAVIASAAACSKTDSARFGAPEPILTRSFTSAARQGIKVSYQVLLPPTQPAAAGLPVCLVLHGKGDDHNAAANLVHLDRALATVTQGGGPPFALVAMDGGDDTYWHARANGDDPQKMLVHELLPRLAAAGMKTQRFALFGWSMGGYGALLLAEVLGRARVAFVAVDSPALWLTGGETPLGAFDDAQDFARHNVFAGRPRLAGIPVRIMCGQSDSFAPDTREFAKGVPDLVAADFPKGGHEPSLWASTAVAQLTPLARALG
jgi:S-formylglutathione hydrolase FrmB